MNVDVAPSATCFLVKERAQESTVRAQGRTAQEHEPQSARRQLPQLELWVFCPCVVCISSVTVGAGLTPLRCTPNFVKGGGNQNTRTVPSGPMRADDLVHVVIFLKLWVRDLTILLMTNEQSYLREELNQGSNFLKNPEEQRHWVLPRRGGCTDPYEYTLSFLSWHVGSFASVSCPVPSRIVKASMSSVYLAETNVADQRLHCVQEAKVTRYACTQDCRAQGQDDKSL